MVIHCCQSMSNVQESNYNFLLHHLTYLAKSIIFSFPSNILPFPISQFQPIKPMTIINNEYSTTPNQTNSWYKPAWRDQKRRSNDERARWVWTGWCWVATGWSLQWCQVPAALPAAAITCGMSEPAAALLLHSLCSSDLSEKIKIVN